MKKLFIPLSAFIMIALGGCSSAKKSQITNHTNQNTSICDRIIRYTIEKVKMIEDGSEIKAHAEITINPFSKNIYLKADDPESGDKTFDTEIESIECSLNETLTKGQAIYKGYIKQKDGKKSWTILTIGFKDDQLVINGAGDDGPSNIYMIIDRWEVVTN